MINSSPQPSHLRVPISWKPTALSGLPLFIATALICVFLDRHVESRRPVQFPTLPAEALEIWIVGDRGVATRRANKPTFRATQHRPKVITQHTIGTTHNLFSHFSNLTSGRGKPYQ